MGAQLLQRRRRNCYCPRAGAERRDEADGEAAPEGQRRRRESSSLAQAQLQKAPCPGPQAKCASRRAATVSSMGASASPGSRR